MRKDVFPEELTSETASCPTSAWAAITQECTVQLVLVLGFLQCFATPSWALQDNRWVMSDCSHRARPSAGLYKFCEDLNICYSFNPVKFLSARAENATVWGKCSRLELPPSACDGGAVCLSLLSRSNRTWLGPATAGESSQLVTFWMQSSASASKLAKILSAAWKIQEQGALPAWELGSSCGVGSSWKNWAQLLGGDCMRSQPLPVTGKVRAGFGCWWPGKREQGLVAKGAPCFACLQPHAVCQEEMTRSACYCCRCKTSLGKRSCSGFSSCPGGFLPALTSASQAKSGGIERWH